MILGKLAVKTFPMKIKSIFLLLTTVVVTLIAQYSYAQTDSVVTDNEIFVVNEQEPEYPGGIAEFYKFVVKEMKYPKDAQKEKQQGKVFVEFIVEKDGTVNQNEVKVIKGVHPSIDAEAIRVMKLSPKWRPVKKDGRSVRMRMVMPFSFMV
jgi:periplasmic protein TonB